MFLHALKYDFILNARKSLQWCIPLLFFMLVNIIFTLSISNYAELSTIGASIIWVGILLSALLSLSHLFTEDNDDGTLDQWLVHKSFLTQKIIARILSHWLFYFFPLILLAPIFATMYHMSIPAIKILLINLLLGTPVLEIQGAIVAAVCVKLRKEALLLAIILLPMYIPTMLFGISGLASDFALLAALFILVITLGPSIIAFALRIGITY